MKSCLLSTKFKRKEYFFGGSLFAPVYLGSPLISRRFFLSFLFSLIKKENRSKVVLFFVRSSGIDTLFSCT